MEACRMPTDNNHPTPFEQIRRALDDGQIVDLDTLSACIIEHAATFNQTYPEQALLLHKIEPGLNPKRAK